MESSRETALAAVICAAGSSSRMGGRKKEYLPLPEGGLTVLASSVLAFASFSRVTRIVITIPAGGDESLARGALPPGLLSEVPERITCVEGGPTRRASVHNALRFLAESPPAYVLIHDGARPWVSPDLIRRVAAAGEKYRAAIPLLPLTDTPKETDSTGLVIRHLRRSSLGCAQTPQVFAFPEILRAHDEAAKKEREGREYTDDAELWAEFIGPVMSVHGEISNRKITFPSDLTFLQAENPRFPPGFLKQN